MTEAEQRAQTMAGAAADTANRLITALPTQFLVLVLMNTVFILGMLWFLDRENGARQVTEQHLAEARERVLVPMLQGCLQHKGD